jgi:hypothetical protein
MTCGVSGIQGMSIFSSGIQGIGPFLSGSEHLRTEFQKKFMSTNTEVPSFFFHTQAGSSLEKIIEMYLKGTAECCRSHTTTLQSTLHPPLTT